MRRQIRDASEEQFARGKTAGASGSRARGAVGGQGSGGSGGGGGGAATSSKSGYQSVGRSTKSARKRGT